VLCELCAEFLVISVELQVNHPVDQLSINVYNREVSQSFVPSPRNSSSVYGASTVP
jgi:hypothetical protein